MGGGGGGGGLSGHPQFSSRNVRTIGKGIIARCPGHPRSYSTKNVTSTQRYVRAQKTLCVVLLHCALCIVHTMSHR